MNTEILLLGFNHIGRANMSTALREACEEKALIETILARQLQEFTARTGLRVTDIELVLIDAACMGDEHRKYVYRVGLDIRVG